MNDLMLYRVVPDDGNTGKNHFELKALVPYKSIVWEEQYDTIGTMQAVFGKDDDTLALVKVGDFATFTETNVLMYIHSVKITDTEIWAYGYEAKALFEKKFRVSIGVSEGTVSIGTKVQAAVEADPFKWLYGIVIGDMGTANLDAMEYGNLLEYITGCCAIGGFGFFVSLEDTEYGKKGYFYVSDGRGLQDITLASVLGNVRDITYTYTDKPYYNSVIAYGIDDGMPHVVRIYRAGLTSNDEIYTNFLDLSMTYPKPDGMSYQDYDNALRTRAQISLGLRHAKESVSVGSIEADCEWGDIVHVLVPDIGVTTTKRVIGITYTSEAGITTKKYKLGEV
jgi:hypothetical protein